MKRKLLELAMISVLMGSDSFRLSQSSQEQPLRERPNVLMIVLDDLNDWTGPMGNIQVKTPNMDRLAQQGVTFQNVHTVSFFCAPLRASEIFWIRYLTN